MSKVAVLRCDNYDFNQVKLAMEQGLNLLGGAQNFVKQNEKILLKPNLLSADPPENCVTTHPSVFKAAAEIFQKAGAILSYGDSPAFQNPTTVAKKTGIGEIADYLGIPLADFRNGQEVSFPQGIQNKKLTIANGILANDGIISLAKLKTHGFAKMTGAIKNQFGCIPGTLKGEFHVKLPNIKNFAQMLVDINMFVKPRLYIMDGIIAMDGNGPRGGKPRPTKVLLLSTDPVALDATVCKIVNLDPQLVPTIVAGQASGLGTYLDNKIEILGDNLEDFIDPDFDINRNPLTPYKPGKTMGLMRNAMIAKPVINIDKCVKCGICVKMCPVDPKAVNWQNGDKSQAPVHQYQDCIRCFCCQELCPESAITINLPLMRKIFRSKK